MNVFAELADRVVWYDGTTSILSEDIEKYLRFADSGRMYCDEITPDIEDFNKVSTKKLKIKKKLEPVMRDWIIPKEITDIDIIAHIAEKFIKELSLSDFTEDEIVQREQRIEYEYTLLQERGLEPLIYVILYVINKFEETKTVWGVGRGSSTSSYILYLLGLHDVDSVEYDLDFSEFIH